MGGLLPKKAAECEDFHLAKNDDLHLATGRDFGLAIDNSHVVHHQPRIDSERTLGCGRRGLSAWFACSSPLCVRSRLQ